ncbi:hypothetical protein [Streptomyces sp. SAI-090]|uniref:hypothetical protein n=1 Tax=Streptomyces sp. SAI-090 TaxID=2940545 RepID=UPI002476EE1F|nr:hypothetical protein [Streptomyces sp. SAI-090]MDH6522255.1 hypothetical protein [Streptomyces sp. SAI-090]
MVEGTLKNLLTDRPAPMYPSSLSVGDHLGVTTSMDDVKQAVPPGMSIGTKNCDQLTWKLGGFNITDAAKRSRVCIFTMTPSIIDAEDDATIPAGESAEVTYTALIPDKLPKHRMNLAVSTDTGKTASPGTTIGQEKALPWSD